MASLADDLVALAALVRAGQVPMLAVAFQTGKFVAPRVMVSQGASLEIYKAGYFAIERMSDQICHLAAEGGFGEQMGEIVDAYAEILAREDDGRPLDS